MLSERVQRQIDRLLDEAEQAMAAGEWELVRLRCEAALALDPDNANARFSTSTPRCARPLRLRSHGRSRQVRPPVRLRPPPPSTRPAEGVAG